MIAVVAIGMLVLLAFARLGGGAVMRNEADTAADAAALAAADQLALGHGDRSAFSAAKTVADANGARLLSCDCGGRAAEVEVEVTKHGASAHGRARAEVDFSGLNAMINH